jgi:hypothetical protein
MSIEQYSALVQIMPQIEDTLKSHRIKVPRPDYNASSPDIDEDEEDDEDDDGIRTNAKANIEATSDEEE